MANAPMAAVLRHIRRLAGPGDEQPPDRQLLEHFAADRDEAAFAALLGRHGPMVLGVCRGVLRDAHAAEDAFQATFLILARKAGSIRRHESVGGWLYQVARHVALQARTATARRQNHERRASVMASAEPWLDLSLRELQEAVGEELARLPERYRAPLVLCYLEGKTKDEAARLLGDSPGSVKGRLERGRQQLRARLTKRGLAPPAGLFAAVLAENLATARVASPLAAATVRAALAAAGSEGLVGVSAEVAALVQGVSQAMATKLKIVIVLAFAAFGAAGAGAFYAAGAARPADPPAAPAAAQAAKAGPPVAEPKAADPGETLHYSGRVTDKETGKPIAGVTVTVRRTLDSDPEEKDRSRLIEQTRHTTDADGRYSFTIPPEQSAQRYLYLEFDVEHPGFAPRTAFGQYLRTILDYRQRGHGSFFDRIELRPAQLATGIVQTPEGQPAAGVKVLYYSVFDPPTPGGNDYGSFGETRTDARGQFQLRLNTPGFAVFWLLPEQYALSTHVLKTNKRGDLGVLTLKPGVRLRGQVLDVKGQPLAGVNVNAEAAERNDEITEPVADQNSRSAVTNDKGEFEFGPLAPGPYLVQPAERPQDASRDRADQRRRSPLSAIFPSTKVILKEGAPPDPIECRAVPHVVIEATYHDSKGQPMRGHQFFASGVLDETHWGTESRVDPGGKLTVRVPHGLRSVQLSLIHNELHALRWRRSKDGPMTHEARWVMLGTLNDDVKGLEIIRYAVPTVLVKVTARDGQALTSAAVTAVYGPERTNGPKISFELAGRPSDVRFEQDKDGRFRSYQLLADEATTVTAHADGYESKSVPVKLAEGVTKEIEIVLEKAPPKDEKE